MNTKGQKFKNITEEMLATYQKKNSDYGDSFSNSLGKFGYIAAATRLHDKLERFITLGVRNTEIKVVDESMRDTLLDLANYAIMTVMFMDAQKASKTEIKFS